MQIELQESTPALAASVIDVALFKEALSRPRVVADSSKYLVYSLKNPASLRVLARSNNAQATFKYHKNDVELAEFVNYKSNVMATAAKEEFFVWFITNADDGTLETKLYFSLVDKVTIRSLSWFLDSKTRTPELIVLYDTCAAQFTSSKLITDYTGTPIEASLRDCALPFERSVTPDAHFTAVGADGLFAFSVDAFSVAVCTARHGNAPAWRPCDGETLVGLRVLQDKPATLVASCANFACVWSIDGEPVRLYKLIIGRPIVLTLACQNTVALFNDSQEVFLIDISNKKILQSTRHKLSYQVPNSSRSVTLNASEGGFVSMSDFNSRIAIHSIRRPSVASPQAAAVAVSSPPAASPAMVDPAIISAVGGGAPRIQGQVPPPAYAPLAAPFVPSVPVAASPAPRATLVNPALPQVSQDGQIAQALDQCQSELAEMKQRLDSAVQNTAQILQLVPQMVKRDHTSLITLSLEAQMTELQNAAKAGEIGTAQQGSNASASGPTGFESQLLATLMDDVARRLVEGLVPGIRDALLSDLEPSLRSAVITPLKKSQKDVFKLRVDSVLKNVGTEFANELDRKQKLYEKQFENYGKEVRRITEGALNKIVQQVNNLEDQLIAITNSGILDEVKQLRQEVQALRAAAATSMVAETNLSPVTIVATAKAMIEGKEAERGLEYVVRLNQKDTTLTLLEEVGQDDSLKDVVLQVTNDQLWESVLLQLSSATRSGQLACALQWVKDIVTDHEGSLKSANVKKALATFIATWKQADVDVAMQKELKVVEKLVR